MEQLIGLIDQYGYIALYGLLALGIVGIPVPDEILMTTVGSLTAGEEPLLSFCMSLLVSFCGAMTGMMISYFLGKKVGKPFLYKFGKWVKLTPERLNVAESWFKKYGLWAVAFGYYVPGIRHFTCYLAGVSNVGIWRYLLFAGSGALIWCSTFLTLGHVIGINAPVILDMMHQYMGLSITVIVLLIAVAFYIYWRIRKKPLL
ncbi:putative membrane protein [Paenibacillus solanacearum]|uniref:Membrane protein n=1 Tax=Paenibacillus solanacearum TaxID=2048548 RepID=A0A916NJB4_9BACL|nr:DedA family protein [Paenibacillus solanacearum]CAG7624598.1 putative membrane protein [Paenibacillus solanacearum]